MIIRQHTGEPRCNERPRDWQNVSAKTRFRYTVEPRCNEPLYNEVLGITNDFLYPNNSKMYAKEPRYGGTSIQRTVKGLAKRVKEVCYIEVSLYRLRELVFAFISLTILTAF